MCRPQKDMPGYRMGEAYADKFAVKTFDKLGNGKCVPQTSETEESSNNSTEAISNRGLDHPGTKYEIIFISDWNSLL